MTRRGTRRCELSPHEVIHWQLSVVRQLANHGTNFLGIEFPVAHLRDDRLAFIRTCHSVCGCVAAGRAFGGKMG